MRPDPRLPQTGAADDADGTVLSLNETETLAAKAARGAGLGWGQAEDIGRAARWLAARGLDWAEPLSRLLSDRACHQIFLDALDIADRMAGAPRGPGWISAPCAPVWALPVVSAAIHGRGIVVILEASGRVFHLGSDGFAASNEPWAGLDALAIQPLSVGVERLDEVGALPHPIMAHARRRSIPASFFNALDAYAALTYVPASAASRAFGAGGSGIDGE